jgi:hypothetical protein
VEGGDLITASGAASAPAPLAAHRSPTANDKEWAFMNLTELLTTLDAPIVVRPTRRMTQGELE